MRRRLSALALALLCGGCGELFTAPPKDPAKLFAAGDLKGAFDAVSYDSEARDRIARAALEAADPVLTLEAVPVAELSRATGLHTLRHMDRSWAFVRVRLGAARRDLGELHAEVVLTDPGEHGLQTMPVDEKHLDLVTGEAYPADIVHSQLKTADMPFIAHVLTMGVITILTLHEEKTYTPPTEDQIKAAVPRALRLKAALGACEGSGSPCEGALVLRRPASDTEPLTAHVAVTLRSYGGAAASIARTLDLEPGGRLEERLARAATGLHLAAVKGAPASYGGQSLDKLACQDQYIYVSSSPSPHERCSPVALAPWPTDEISPIGIVPPPVPEKLGTPEGSSAARPEWSRTDDYAPDVTAGALDSKVPVPVPESAEGALITCKQDALNVPDEDTDHVYAMVKIDKKWWREDGSAFSLPLLSIDSKTKISVSFYDWDYLSGDDHLATVTLKREGDHMIGTWGSKAHAERAFAQVTCRIFAREAVEAAFARLWVQATDQLDGIAEAHVAVHPDSSDFGEGKSGLPDARSFIRRGAALVGWDDPRIQNLIARHGEADVRFWAGVRTSIESLHAGADGAVTLEKPTEPELEYHGAKRICGAEAAEERKAYKQTLKGKSYDAAWLEQACLVKVTIENKKRTAAYQSSVASALTLVLEDGRAVESMALGPHELAPGQSVDVTVLPTKTPPAASRKAKPWRLVARGFRSAVILPVAESP